jgi:hypothetical protein
MSKQLVDPDIVKETLQTEAAFSDDEEKDACQVWYGSFVTIARPVIAREGGFFICSSHANDCSFHHRASPRPSTIIALGRSSLTRAC